MTAPRMSPKPAGRSITAHPYSVLGFVGFCAAFAAVATLLDKTSPRQTQTSSSQETFDFDLGQPRQNSPASPPPSGDIGSKPDTGSQALKAPDHFNRYERTRTPWVLRRVVSTTEAQVQVAQRQSAQQERSAAKKDRQETARRRQQEIDRFTESRKLAYETLNRGQETPIPRGRHAERDMHQFAPSRQRSMSSASSVSVSSFESF